MSLTAEELARYQRHIILPELGADGQLKLKNASVLIVGTGGLGSPIAMYLAASGVGHNTSYSTAGDYRTDERNF